MPDPFDALHTPVAAVEPDPAFAARLRARIQRALALPEGVDMPRSRLAPEPTSAEVASAGVIPYLAVADARRALAWYADALGAHSRGEPIVMPDGRIGHAEVELAGGVVMLADEHPELGVVAPTGEGAAITLHLQVGDVDTTVERAVAAGARLDRPPADHPYGRNAVVLDPFGHRWLIAGPLRRRAQSRPGHGEVSYASVWVADVERAARFYAAVLGWRYAPGSAPQGRRVEGVEPPLGLWGGQQHRTTFLCFAVDDVGTGVERVRAAGGRAGEPRQEPYGLVADCVDDQGMPFALLQAGASRRTSDDAPPGHGSLAYFVMGVADVARAQGFFSSVLGWRFTPGHTEGGWDIMGTSPAAGLHGGSDVPVVVPMYAVDDVHAAVARVRAAGGAASEPERMPYGIIADCTDDQGAAFYLGQLS